MNRALGIHAYGGPEAVGLRIDPGYRPARKQGQSIFSAPRRVRRHVYGVSPTIRWKERVKCC